MIQCWSARLIFKICTNYERNLCRNFCRNETSSDAELSVTPDGHSNVNNANGVGTEDLQPGSPEGQNPVSHAKLFSYLKLVKLDSLTPEEKLIHQIHVQALKREDDVYKDPATGYDVLTRLAHLRRGECCGNACRHCPYGHKSVPADQRKKRFNSAFFV